MSENTLSSDALFAEELPAGAEPALEALRTLHELSENKTLPERNERARAAYRALLGALGPLRDATPPGDTPPPAELDRRWVEAVLLWMRFCQTSSPPLLDSLGTSTLREYPVDLPPDPQAFERLRQALARATKLSPAELAEAERSVTHLCSVLPLKTRLTEALKQRVEAGRSFADLMRDFYGALPWRAGDVDFVLTSTAIFFVLPLAGESLEVADWAERPLADRALLEGFLQRLGKANKAETWRFPAFGLFDLSTLSEDLCLGLAEDVGVRPELVKKTLATMVSVLPKDEIDQYLVHDAWGHTWQEVLSEFEWEYALVREMKKPLTPGDGPLFGGEPTAPFARAFTAENGSVRLDQAALLASVEADLRGRIQAGLSVALSELFADFVEAKYSRLNREQPLPTSSLLAVDTLKFDLTIGDVSRQARRWAHPYNQLKERDEQARFARELAAQGLPEAGLLAAVEQMARAIHQSFAPAFRPELGRPGDPPCSNVAIRTLLELALLSSELEGVLTESGSARPSPAWTKPALCPDLWAVCLSHLYEADRRRRFFCLDWLLREPLRQRAEALGRELAAPG